MSMRQQCQWVSATLSRPIVLLALIGSSLAFAAQPPKGDESPAPPDPLVALNNASRAAYRRAKEAALARSGPVILVAGNNLVLKAKDRRTEVRFTPEIYHTLKAVCHIPLAIDVMLAFRNDEDRIDDDLAAELRRYRESVAAAQERLATLELDPELRERQRKILSSSLEFLDSVVERRRCGRDERIAYTRRLTPLVMANTNDAARAQLDSLHRHVGAWRRQLTPEEWGRLSVVVMGTQLPRKENLAVQYFARLLGEPGEGRRITYAEALFEEPRALDLLATRAVDTQIGVDFFNDPTRMHRDLLADAARDYLPLLVDDPSGNPGK
jgi:hypothetical protein